MDFFSIKRLHSASKSSKVKSFYFFCLKLQSIHKIRKEADLVYFIDLVGYLVVAAHKDIFLVGHQLLPTIAS